MLNQKNNCLNNLRQLEESITLEQYFKESRKKRDAKENVITLPSLKDLHYV